MTHNYPTYRRPHAGVFVQNANRLLEQAGYNVTVLNTRLAFCSLAWFSLRGLWLVLTRRFDRIIAHWWVPSGVLGCVLSAITGKPLIIHVHGADIRILKKSRFLVWLCNVVTRRASTICFVSRFLRDEFIKFSRLSWKERIMGELDSSARYVILPMPVLGGGGDRMKFGYWLLKNWLSHLPLYYG